MHQDSWRTENGNKLLGSRTLRGVLATLLCVGLAVLFYYLVFSPYWHPNTHLAVLSGGESHDQFAPPLQFVSEDAAGLEPLSNVLYGTRPPRQFSNLQSLAEMQALAENLANMPVDASDVLIVYASAHGVSTGGQASLLCGSFDARTGRIDHFWMGDLLDRLARSKAKVKLLLLELGDLSADAREGMLLNAFPKTLVETATAADPSIWILCSHSPLETAQTSSALVRSVFGFFVSRGLQGAADLNGNRLVELLEFAQYVRAGTNAWVSQSSGGNKTQTPFLIRCGNGSAEASPILLPVRQPLEQSESEAVNTTVALAAKNSRSAAYYAPIYVPSADSVAENAASKYLGPLGYRAVSAVRGGAVGGGNGNAAPPAEVASDSTAKPQEKPAAAPPGETAAPSGEKGAQPATEESAESKEKEGGEPVRKTPAKPAPTIPAQLAEAWALRDVIAAGEAGFDPLARAPHVWRALEMRLLYWEELYRSGESGDVGEISAKLSLALPLLKQLAAGEPIVLPPRPREYEKQLALLGNHIELPLGLPTSLAMAEEESQASGKPLTEKLQAAADALNLFAEGSEGRTAFLTWAAENWQAEYDPLAELRFARLLADSPQFDWETVQVALQTRVLAEQIAAGAGESLQWLGQPFAEAEKSRLAGEQVLLDGLGSDFQERGIALLWQARRAYESIQSDLENVREAKRLMRDLLHRFPAYLTWREVAGNDPDSGAPRYDDLVAMSLSLTELNELLAAPDYRSLSLFAPLVAELNESKLVVEGGLAPRFVEPLLVRAAPGDPPRIRAMLATSLPAAETRVRLLTALVMVETKLAGKYDPPLDFPKDTASRPASPELWQWRREQADLQYRLIRLAGVGVNKADLAYLEELMGALEHELPLGSLPAANMNAESLYAAFDEAGQALGEIYRNLPSQIHQTVKTNRDLSHASSHASRLQNLQEAQSALLLVDHRDAVQVETVPEAMIRRGEWYDLLVWQEKRASIALEDSSLAESAALLRDRQRLRTDALAVPGQPPLPASKPPWLQLSGTTRVELAAEPEARAEMNLSWLGTAAEEVRIVLDYDPKLLAVDVPSQGMFFMQPPYQAGQAIPYPWTPAETTPASVRIQAGSRHAFRLAIRRLGSSPYPTKVVVKAIAGDFRVRHEIAVSVPAPDQFALGIFGLPESYTQGQAPLLKPYPNQAMTYQFTLANEGKQNATVDVEFLAAGANRPAMLPTGALSAVEADRYLAAFGNNESLVKLERIELLAGGAAISLPFPKPPPKPPEVPGAPPPVKPSLAKGLLLVISNSQLGRKTIKLIDFAVQRPQRYVLPKVSYDPVAGEISVEASAVAENLVPPAGVAISADFSPPLKAGTESLLLGTIQAPAYKTRLYAKVRPERDHYETLHLHVDGFPRAFIYRVPCWRSENDIAPEVDLLAVRLAELPQGEVYQAPLASIPAVFELDAPAIAFQNEGDLFEAGIDADRDRELLGETTLKFKSDRQVDVFFDYAAPGGVFAVTSKVTDFHLNLPAPGLSNAQVGVLGRLRVSDRTAWSGRQEIKLDGAGPRIFRPQVEPADEEIPAGTELDVTVLASDDGFSGVEKIELALDAGGVGKFLEDPAPLPAVAGEGGSYQAKIPTAGLGPGEYTILARGVDKIGNVGPYLKIEGIKIAPPKTEEESEFSVRIEGRVMYAGKVAVPAAEVELIAAAGPKFSPARTNERGEYVFVRVPAGSYKIQVKPVVVRNKPRSGDAEIEVTKKSAATLQKQVDIR